VKLSPFSDSRFGHQFKVPDRTVESLQLRTIPLAGRNAGRMPVIASLLSSCPAVSIMFC
jgi:hypothetical protein